MPDIGLPRSPDKPVPGSPDESYAALAAGAPSQLVVAKRGKEPIFAPTDPRRLGVWARLMSAQPAPARTKGLRLIVWAHLGGCPQWSEGGARPPLTPTYESRLFGLALKQSGLARPRNARILKNTRGMKDAPPERGTEEGLSSFAHSRLAGPVAGPERPAHRGYPPAPTPHRLPLSIVVGFCAPRERHPSPCSLSLCLLYVSNTAVVTPQVQPTSTSIAHPWHFKSRQVVVMGDLLKHTSRSRRRERM
eukprot:scaffold91012_cov32-Tisochrysis_lutea.AAC.1